MACAEGLNLRDSIDSKRRDAGELRTITLVGSVTQQTRQSQLLMSDGDRCVVLVPCRRSDIFNRRCINVQRRYADH